MVDKILVEDLCVAPSHRWPTIIARHELVTEYLSLESPSTSDVDAFAGRADLSRRSFYRLLEDRKARSAGAEAPTLLEGRGRRISNAEEAIIAEAIRRVGPGAYARDVFAEALRISTGLGATPPSEFAVNARVREPRGVDWIVQRLPEKFDWVLDACSLDLNVHDGPGGISPACLLALIDLRSGSIPAFKLTAGCPDLLAVASLFIQDPTSALLSGHDRRRTLAATAALREQAAALTRVLERYSVKPSICPPKTLRSGEALMMILGRKLGNISLRPRLRSEGKTGILEAVDLAIAEAVTSSVIAARNSALEAPWAAAA